MEESGLTGALTKARMGRAVSSFILLGPPATERQWTTCPVSLPCQMANQHSCSAGAAMVAAAAYCAGRACWVE